MDLYLVLHYVPERSQATPQRVSKIYTMARTWRGAGYHRACNAMASAAGEFSYRLSAWFNTNDYFSNPRTMQAVSRYLIAQEEIVKMAKKQTVPAFNRESTWKGFLEYRMTDLELLDADETVVTDEWLMEEYIKLIMAGDKLTGTYKASSKTATATMQAGETQGELAGWAISAAGRDPREALKLLFYKHYECLKQNWKQLLEADRPVRRG